MKRILLIGTGGTVASVATADGLTPGRTGQELLAMVPGLAGRCEIDCVQPFALDSTNIRPGHWLLIAEQVRSHYQDYDGFVITHGTDTMAYTAAGLTYLIQNSAKPIVLTGSQKPAGEDFSDAAANLTDAVLCALEDGSHGVQIVFSGSIIAGSRARKNYSKSFTAFGSVNFPELGRVQDGKVLRYFREETEGEPVFSDYLDPNVGLLRLTPGVRNDVLQYLLEKYDGMILESYGVGGLPEYSDFYEQVRAASEAGKLIVMTTQVPNEGSDLSVYRVGNRVKSNLRVLEARDMSSEAALAKVMWILGKTNDFEQAKRLFYTPVAHDILCGREETV